MKIRIRILVIIMIVTQILFNLIVPIKALTEDDVTIQCNDINFYDALVEKLEGKIKTQDEETKTITMTRENVESITSIIINDRREESKRIQDITGIEKFTNLQSLNLEYNKVDNLEPIRGLTQLRILLLESNKVTNLELLKELTNLRCINLVNNEISNIEPLKNLTELPYLTYLDLFGNQISNIEPLENLTNLTYLNLDDNQISNIEPLKNLTNLSTLYMDNNQISDIEPLKNLTNLTSLHISNNEISNIDSLESLNKLTSLHIDKNKVSNMEKLESLTDLTSLHINNNQISNIEPLKSLTNLTYLGLNDNQISNIEPLENLTNLAYLGLNNNEISNIEPLKNLTNLASLDLDGNKISDITPVKDLKDLNLYVRSNLINNKLYVGLEETGIKEVELPKIILDAKDSTSNIYTSEEYILKNCTLTSDGQKIKINTEQVDTAEVIIQGGKATGTTFSVSVIRNDITPPILQVTKSIETLTNQNVLVTIMADEEIQEVSGWTLSTDRKNLTKTYTENTKEEETITVKDLAENTATVKISITNIDKVLPEVDVTYTPDEKNQNVLVTITANEEIQEVSGWTLSTDKRKLTKIYSSNKTETITVKDMAGNEKVVRISINNIKQEQDNNNKENGTQSGEQGNNNSNENSSQAGKEDNSKASGILPYTGQNTLMILIGIFLIITIITFIKSKQYKDID